MTTKIVDKGNKQRLFYLVAILLPVLFLAFIEFVLRLVNFGEEYPLFVERKELQGYFQPNPELIKRYFSNPEQAPNVSPDTVFFTKEKQEDVFRVVVQGGSSAAGFPFGRYGSLQGMLEQRFKRAYPDKKIEVINTAMAAVNTYTLMDMTEEIIAIEPDVVLIYTGHNEYLGVLGVGSQFAGSSSRFATLAFLTLKDFKLYQAIEKLVIALKGESSSAENNIDDGRSLMSKVAQGQYVEFDSKLYHAGINQFQANLSQILADYKKANIPVFIGNLISIEKGMPPFSSIGKVYWHSIKGNLTTATVTQMEHPATKYYAKALLDYQNENFAEAKLNFQLARDHDSLRFRAPSEFNNIIKTLATEYQANLVNVDERVRREADNSILGEKHLLEHVHPTVRGYFLLADAFYNELINSNLLGESEFLNNRALDVKIAWQDIPLTEVDITYGEFKIANLKSDYPFVAESQPRPQMNVSTEMEKLIARRIQGDDWFPLQQDLLRLFYKNGDFENAARVAGIMASAIPNDAALYQTAGRLYLKAKDLTLSYYYFQKSYQIEAANPGYALNYAHVLFLLERYQESLAVLKKGQSLGEQQEKFARLINQVQRYVQ
ncbi:MAG: hypothetical protein HWE10_13060 [Gammaproteobacteria bacterium]|nr:hypothetical protein [Gammaproteobacteria bacterium]